MNLLRLLLLLALQDPDRSTPEKAARAFFAFEESWNAEVTKPEYDTLPAGAFCRTPEFTSRLKRQADKWKAWRTASKYEVSNAAEMKDGRVVVDVSHKFRERKDRGQGKWEWSDGEEPIRLVLAKEGGSYLVSEYHHACFLCEGLGKCGDCKGTGRGNEKGKCSTCGGSAKCTNCGGARLTRQELANRYFPFCFVPEDWNPPRSKDLSTAKSAAKTYVDAILSRRIEGFRVGKRLAEWLTARLRVYYSEAAAKQIEASVAQGPERGKAWIEAAKTAAMVKLESVSEAGETAYAVLRWDRVSRMPRSRVLLKKVGDQWLADEDLDECHWCKASGRCTLCEGSGKGRNGTDDCFNCKGKKVCETCRGVGWAEWSD